MQCKRQKTDGVGVTISACLAMLISAPLDLVWAKDLPVARPEKVGFSERGLEKLSQYLRKEGTDKKYAGVVALIVKEGKIAYFEAFGYADVEERTSMEKDSIFRIYSMTKPITSVAAMILWEEGKFKLDDPASKYIPALGNMKIRHKNNQGETITSPTSRDMTVRDLMRHTSGLTYEADPKYQGEAAALGPNLQQYVDALGELPLAADPGTFWLYGSSTDVLGRLVEVWSGQTLDVFFEERIFKPLKMPDTAFWVPWKKHDRLTQLYRLKSDGTITPSYANPSQDGYRRPVRRLMGGAGLTGTTMDYARFCQMMLNGGELDGVRLLEKGTVSLMTRDHLGDKISKQYATSSVRNLGGFGLGFYVIQGPVSSPKYSQVGSYGWGGAASTVFWIDPRADVFGIFMIQVMPNGSVPGGVGGGNFRSLVYEAIDK